jgi:hypothetical protein
VVGIGGQHIDDLEMTIHVLGEGVDDAERVNPFETACSPDSCHSFS